MVGREVLLRVEKRAVEPGEPLLAGRGPARADDRGLEAVRGVTFGCAPARSSASPASRQRPDRADRRDRRLRTPSRAGSLVAGHDVTHATAKTRSTPGIGHIPEDRQRHGLVLTFSLAENLALHDYRHAADSRRGWLFRGRASIARARDLLQGVRRARRRRRRRPPPLSGGNQQKVILAREIDARPEVLIAAQPTRGLDVGAIEFVHRRLVEQRDAGRAILLVSLELEEMLSLADRIVVHLRGQDRRRVPADGDRGGARRRDDRRRPRGGAA